MTGVQTCALPIYGVDSGKYTDQAAVDAALAAKGGLNLVHDGDIIDLGGMQFKVIETPGHQEAGIMLFDETTGYLFSSDQIGNNRTHLTDSFWMQFGDGVDANKYMLAGYGYYADSMDVYLSTLQIALDKIGKECTNIFTGHNDVTLDGQGAYLSNFEKAVQKVVDNGKDALTPTLRTLGYESYKNMKIGRAHV